jgi:hypothetical protein
MLFIWVLENQQILATSVHSVGVRAHLKASIRAEGGRAAVSRANHSRSAAAWTTSGGTSACNVAASEEEAKGGG